jgi:hypothetical protein
MTRTVCLALTWVLFSIMVAAGCDAPVETTDPTPWDDNVDGLQACIDTCTLKAERCQESMDCATWCAEIFKNAGAECQDEITAQWACMIFYYKDDGPECQNWPAGPCQPVQTDADRCTAEYGCTTREWWNIKYPPSYQSKCISGPIGPNEEQGCSCAQACQLFKYRSDCWTQGTTSFCKCYAGDDILMGTCEGGPEPFCDPNVYNGCCNQYFMINL